ncbi:MAG: 50S ribosomal protein L3 [Patescibacteria group bacterium]|nr:50S ribosomal protein L3 [Patescibacteria group bacterium]
MSILIGKKMGMTSLTSKEGVVTPVTAVKVEPCEVTQIKTVETDGYSAIVVGASSKKEGKVSPQKYKRYAEYRIDDVSGFEKGSLLSAENFTEEDLLRVTGTSIGKGFAGAIKRWNFSRGPQSHGGKYTRAIGGTSGATNPGRVMPGKKMPGHMGARKTTLSRLKVCKVDSENGVLFVKGSLPGANNGTLVLRKQS